MMQYLLVLLAISAACELLLTVGPWWRLRLLLAGLALVTLSAACTGTVLLYPGLWSALLVLIGLYRVFNLVRVIENRVPAAFGRYGVRKTALWLLAAQVVVLAIIYSGWLTGPRHYIWALVSVQLAVALGLAWSMMRSLRTTSPSDGHGSRVHLNDRDLPSITVAIPARNEDTQLEACLDAILASNYPKLEVIALDDCSQDRTPEIIKRYAHDGVRFIRGQEPSKGWLAKNQAYDRLYQEANGKLILFCGVDVRFGPDSIRQLVTALIQRDKTMIDVLPLNPPLTVPHHGHYSHHLPLAQLMRYYWEMAPPRRLFNRPPVLSTCWLITRDSLHKAGGFKAVRRSVTPEAHFAKAAVVHDNYSFLRSDRHLGISSQKPPAEQLNTALQTRYPQLHRRPELVLLIALAELTFILAPLAIAVFAGVTAQWLLLAAAVVTLALHGLTFQALWHSVFTYRRWLSSLLFVPAVITDLVLLHYSMYKYEFSEVYWKGRNVCYPVMRVYPRLPKID